MQRLTLKDQTVPRAKKEYLPGSIIYAGYNLNDPATDGPTPIQRFVQRSSPIIDKASEYYTAAARFVCPQVGLPVWVPDLEIGQAASPPLKLNYWVTMRFGAQVVTQQMLLRRTDFTAPIPEVPLTAQPSSTYAFYYSQADVIKTINEALYGAFSGLTGLPATARAPYITYNPEAGGLMSMWCMDFASWDVDGATPIEIFFSASFQPFLEGWPTFVYNERPSQSAANNYLDIQLIVQNNYTNWQQWISASSTWRPAPGLPGDPGFPSSLTDAILEVRQSFTSWPAFSPVSSIQVVCQGLSLESQQQVDLPLSVRDSSTVASPSAAITMDFTPDYSRAGDNTRTLVYTPSSIIPGARFISLYGDHPIQSFSIAVQWVDSKGNVRPMYVQTPQQTCSILLVFVKRELVDSTA